MSRSPGAFMIALLVAACTPTPAPTLGPTAAPPSIEPAKLDVTGSGRLCGPWWMGCGAVLVVEQPGWVLPEDWAPSADDTIFAVDLRAGSERPSRVTGVWEPGRERIEPGEYRLFGLLTRSPDTLPVTLSADVGCAVDLLISPGTRAVSVDVDFAIGGCTIAVSMDAPTAAPSA